MFGALWQFFTDPAVFRAWVARVQPVQIIRAAILSLGLMLGTGAPPLSDLTKSLGTVGYWISGGLIVLAALLRAGDSTKAALTKMTPTELNAAGVATVSADKQAAAAASAKP